MPCDGARRTAPTKFTAKFDLRNTGNALRDVELDTNTTGRGPNMRTTAICPSLYVIKPHKPHTSQIIGRRRGGVAVHCGLWEGKKREKKARVASFSLVVYLCTGLPVRNPSPSGVQELHLVPSIVLFFLYKADTTRMHTLQD